MAKELKRIVEDKEVDVVIAKSTANKRMLCAKYEDGKRVSTDDGGPNSDWWRTNAQIKYLENGEVKYKDKPDIITVNDIEAILTDNEKGLKGFPDTLDELLQKPTQRKVK